MATRVIKTVHVEGVTLTATRRKNISGYFTERIRYTARLGKVLTWNHGSKRIEVSVAYRNDSNNPDEMTYFVGWYEVDIKKKVLHLVECENGVRLEQAALAMADFILLAEAGLTLKQILYPAA